MARDLLYTSLHRVWCSFHLENSATQSGATRALFYWRTRPGSQHSSALRYACVLFFPFKIYKFIVNGGRTVAAVVSVFVLTVLPLPTPVLFNYVFELRFDALRNRTLHRIKNIKSPISAAISKFDVLYKLVLMNFTPFVIIVLCAIILTIQLKRSTAWRYQQSREVTVTTKGSYDKNTAAQRKFPKDIRVARTVLTIAIACIAPGTLGSVKYVILMMEPEFYPNRTYAKSFEFTVRMEYLLSLRNSSVNFIIYYKMSTKFRDTVKGIVLRK